MPRDASGTYTKPLPDVVGNTTIEATWANTSMDDLATAMTDSLSRSGQGGMLVPLGFADGTVTAPGISWNNEANTGFYRSGAGDHRISVLGNDLMRWNSVSGTQIWDGAAWQDSIYNQAMITVVSGTSIDFNSTLRVVDGSRAEAFIDAAWQDIIGDTELTNTLAAINAISITYTQDIDVKITDWNNNVDAINVWTATTPGVFIGEITNSAPADESVTTKPDGFVWFEI